MMGKLAALLLAALLLAAPALAGDFHGQDISGASYASPDHPFLDHDGNPRTLRDFRGRVTVVFFGFMNCPNFCPLTLAKLREAIGILGDAGKDVRVAYVTLDPERDTPERLKNYVTAFHPDFIGLHVPPEAVDGMAKAFRVYNRRIPGKAPGSYTIDHSLFAYVYDRQGRIRLQLPDELGAAEVAADLGKLLREN